MHRVSLTAALLVGIFSCASPDQAPPEAAQESVSAGDSLLRIGEMSLPPGDSIRFELRAVPDSRLARFLADGERRAPLPAASGASPIDPTAFLYAVASEGSCVEDTHGICYHDYLLAVRSEWTDLRPRVYEIGQAGDISEFRWLSDQPGNYHLRLVLHNWPEHVLRSNAALTLRQDTVDVSFNADSLWVTRSTVGR